MIFYKRLRKAHVLTGKYFQNIINFSITFAYDWVRCAFLCLYIILKWMLKKMWFIHVSGNAKQITSVSLQHKRFYFLALWQAIIVVDGHRTNANKQTPRSVTFNHSHNKNNTSVITDYRRQEQDHYHMRCLNHWLNQNDQIILIIFLLPGPLAPPRKMRPRRKIIALSYSFTICKNKKYFYLIKRA